MLKVLAPLLVPLVGLLSGCLGPPDDAEARLAQVRKNGESMEQLLDMVEDRLLGNQAVVSKWRELADRHRSVSELACTSVDRHMLEMVELSEKEAEKSSRRSRGRQLRAQRPVPGVGGP